MSDDILTPPDALCECGLPYCDPIHVGDADVEDEVRKRAEFDQTVAKRTEELIAEKKYFVALVAYKAAMARDPNQTSVPKPRSPAVDAAELALIEARDFRARVDHRVAQMVQAARGADGEYVTPKGPSRDEWAAGLGKSAAFEVKDGDHIEIKDGPLA
jgi:hypothetical protein